jgi:hypothetical protein
MPQIPAAIPTQAFELIRNRIAEILVDELPSQATLAGDAQLNARVFVERFVQFDLTEIPAVNVSINRTAYSEQTQRNTDGEHTFSVDVHTSAKSTSAVRGDSLAIFRLQKLLGVVRGILEDSRYKTLGFAPPFIESRKVTSIEYAQPTEGDGTSTVVGRITFVVRAPDRSGVVTPELIAGYDTQVKLALTNKGYIFTGDNIPVPPVTGAEISVNGTFYIEAEEGDIVDIPVVNTGGDAVGSVTAGVSVVVPNATYTLEDTDGNTLSTGSIPSGGSADIVAPDGTVLRDGLPYGSVLSGGTIDVPSAVTPCADATFSIDGTQVDTVASGADIDITLLMDGVPPPSYTYNPATDTLDVEGVKDLVLKVFVETAATDAGPITIDADSAGTITAVNDGGLTNLVIEVNSIPVTAPFVLALADTLEFTFDAASADTAIRLTGTY